MKKIYKVGDKVRIVKHKKGSCKFEHCAGYIPNLMAKKGKVLTIKGKASDDPIIYHVEDDEYYWNYSPCMIELVKTKKVAKKKDTSPSWMIKFDHSEKFTYAALGVSRERNAEAAIIVGKNFLEGEKKSVVMEKIIKEYKPQNAQEFFTLGIMFGLNDSAFSTASKFS